MCTTIDRDDLRERLRSIQQRAETAGGDELDALQTELDELRAAVRAQPRIDAAAAVQRALNDMFRHWHADLAI